MSSADTPLTAEALATLMASMRPPDRRVSVMSPTDYERAGRDLPTDTLAETTIVTNNHIKPGEVYLVPPKTWEWIRDFPPKLQAAALRVTSAEAGPDEAVLATWAEIDPLAGGGR